MTTQKVELKRDLTRIESYATIIGMLVGSGIFVVTGEAGAIAGPSVPLAYLALAPVILTTAVAYSVYMSTPLGMRPGGAYIHISRTMQSYYVGFIALWLKWLAYIGALVILSTSLGRYMKFFYPDLDQTLAGILPFGQALKESYLAGPSFGEAVVATAALLFFFIFNLVGVKFYGWLQTAMFIVLCIAIVILVVPGLFAVDMNNFSPLFPYGFWATSTPGGEVGFLAALPSLFFSYAGFESLAQTAGETKEARRSLPRIFINGILISMLIFFSMSFVAFGVVPHDELARSSYAMSDVAHRFLPLWGSAVVTVGALMAFMTSLNATLYVPARILYVFGDDRMLPQSLARVSARFRTPWVSLVVNVAVALLLLWTKSFGYVLNIALVAMFLLYGLHSASLVALPFIRPALYQKAEVRLRPSVLVVLGTVSFLSMGYLAVVTIARDIARQRADPGGIALWQLLLLWVIVGTVLYLIGRWEGRRSGFDYKRQLTREWMEEEHAASGNA
ncbi:MAG TPA: APC family permease [Blastocatellia bacterium]|nr:APC family permease [Blastocatellia bacterium]